MDRRAARELHELFLAGALPRRALERGLQELGVGRDWVGWIRLVLLVVGGSLLLAAAAFAVAHNWHAIGELAKLAGLALLVAGAAAFACWRGLDRVEGCALLCFACVLVGVFWAAFGQVYQTGADAWELFAAWALSIAAWAFAARVPLHGLLLLAVVDLAIAFYCDEVRFQRWEHDVGAWGILAATQILALVGYEFGRRRAAFRVEQLWARWLLVAAVLFHLAGGATSVVFGDRYDLLASWCVLLGLAASAVVGYRFYRRVEPDLFALTCIGFACAWVVNVVALRSLAVFQSGSCARLTFVGLLDVGLLALLANGVRRLQVVMQAEARDG